MLRSFAKASAIYAAGSFASKAAKFFLIPVYVRYLTPEEVGVIVFLEALMFALVRMFSLGLPQAVKRFYIEFPDTERADTYANTLWWLSIVLVILGAGMMVALASVGAGAITASVGFSYLALAIVAAAVRSVLSLPMQRFIVRREPEKFGLFNLGEFATTAGLIMYFVIVTDSGAYGVLWGQIISCLVWGIAFGFLLGRSARPFVRNDRIAASVRYSLPLLPHAIFTWGITFADRIILERLVPLHELGVYGVGYQLASVLPVLSLAMLDAWLPRYFRTADSRSGAIEYWRTLNVFCALVGATAVIVAFSAEEIVGLVATADYVAAVPILHVVVAGLIFHGLYHAFLFSLFYDKKGAAVSLATGMALLANVSGNIIFVPIFGIMASAWVTVGAYVVATIIAAWKSAGLFSAIGIRNACLACSAAVIAFAVLVVAHLAGVGKISLFSRYAICLSIVIGLVLVSRAIAGRLARLEEQKVDETRLAQEVGVHSEQHS